MTAYDWLLARRTFSLGLVLGTLVFLVMLATDDATSTLPGRLGRLAVLASLAGGGGAFIATEQSRSRGEMRALGAAGVPPVKAVMGAVLGGAVIGALGSGLAIVPRVDLTPLFPRVAPLAVSWLWQGDSWFDSMGGVVVHASGDLSRVGSAVPSGLGPPPTPRLATALALGLAAFGFPLWATAPAAAFRRSIVGLSVAGTSVAVFHLVAAGRVPPVALAIPATLLLADAVSLHWRGSWQ